MVFFISMFICNLLVPIIMLVAGYYMANRPPERINNFVGYRTRMSKLNDDTWLFAHNCCGRLWMRQGTIVLILTVLVQIPFARSGVNVVGIMAVIVETIQILVLLGTIVQVERALKRTFDENGNRR